MNKLLFFCATKIECCFLPKSTIFRSKVQYSQYCTLLDQSDYRVFVR